MPAAAAADPARAGGFRLAGWELPGITGNYGGKMLKYNDIPNAAGSERANAARERCASGLIGPGDLALSLVLAERSRQVELGYTPEHDDGHTGGELARAAACYALGSESAEPGLWPWLFEPAPPPSLSNCVRAAALLHAEAERLLRAGADPGEAVGRCQPVADPFAAKPAVELVAPLLSLDASPKPAELVAPACPEAEIPCRRPEPDEGDDDRHTGLVVGLVCVSVVALLLIVGALS